MPMNIFKILALKWLAIFGLRWALRRLLSPKDGH